MTATLTETPPARPQRSGGLPPGVRIALYAGLALLVVATVRVVTGSHQIDAPGSLNAALLATCPILLAALGGLWSERAGVVNIGLEGQILLGTWGTAFFTYHFDVYVGLLGGIACGVLGGLLHALATVTFGVDHIVSGVALNVIALGLTTFLSEVFFSELNSERGVGGPRQLSGLEQPPEITIPGISDAAVDLADKHWFVISDLASVVAVFTKDLSVVTVLVFALVALTGFLLWRTPFGLRLRSCGENPQAAESLGVAVLTHKYVAVLVSGGLAGLGGAYLTTVSSQSFVTDQAGGRGYIGLAAMIFGNWRPTGVLVGSGMFGYTDSLRFRDETTIHALLLPIGIALLAYAVYKVVQAVRRGEPVNRKTLAGVATLAVAGAGFLAWYVTTDSVPRDFTSMTPYVITLLVLAFFAQRLRMPKADGQIYRRGTAG